MTIIDENNKRHTIDCDNNVHEKNTMATQRSFEILSNIIDKIKEKNGNQKAIQILDQFGIKPEEYLDFGFSMAEVDANNID